MSLELELELETIESPETVPETETEFKGTIYAIDFPNGKRYVGLTVRSISDRYKDHRKCARNPSTSNKSIVYKAIRKYDMVETFTLKSIDTSAKTIEELANLEIAYIAKFKTYVGNGGYNMTLGGEGAHGCIKTREARIKSSLARMKTDIRPFSCWNLSTGSFEGTFNNYFEANEKINKRVTIIGFAYILSGKSRKSRGYIARYFDEFPADFAENPVKVIEWYEEQCIERKREKEKKRKELKSFNMFREGKFVKRFDFYCDCFEFIKTTYNIDRGINISWVLNGKLPVSQGFVFRYVEDMTPIPNNLRTIVNNREFTVYRENAFIGTFSKQNVAAKYLQENYNIKYIHVSDCLTQKLKSSQGFRFEYSD